MALRIKSIQIGYSDKSGFHPAGSTRTRRTKSKRKRALKSRRRVAANPRTSKGRAYKWYYLWKDRQSDLWTISRSKRDILGTKVHVTSYLADAKTWVDAHPHPIQAQLFRRRNPLSGRIQRQTANPIPTRWTPAKVMRTKRGEVKVMIPNPFKGRRDVATGLRAGEHWYLVLQYGHEVSSHLSRKAAEAAARKLNRDDPKSAKVVHVRPRY